MWSFYVECKKIFDLLDLERQLSARSAFCFCVLGAARAGCGGCPPPAPPRRAPAASCTCVLAQAAGVCGARPEARLVSVRL